MPEVYANIDSTSEGHSIWGEGLFIWSVYKVDVRYGEEKPWSIYRRFAHFANLIEQLKTYIDPTELIPFQQIISIGEDTQVQDKLYQSTVLAVPTEIGISQRKPMLNKFLEEICKNTKITSQDIFKEFIDEPRKGVPGAVRVLTLRGEKIIWNKLTRTNKPTFMVDFYPLWSIKFLILTQKGVLYLLTTMYDQIEKAELVLDLKRPSDILVEGFIVHMRVGPSDRISFELSNTEEVQEFQTLVANIPKNSEAFGAGDQSSLMSNPMNSAKISVTKPKDDVTDNHGYAL